MNSAYREKGVTPYLCSDDRDNPRSDSILRCIHRHTCGGSREGHCTQYGLTRHHTLQDATGSKLQLRLHPTHTTHQTSAAISTYAFCQHRQPASRPPAAQCRLSERPRREFHSFCIRRRVTWRTGPDVSKQLLPSPSWFNNPVTLPFATTDLTENTPIRIVTNINSSHRCYSDVQVSRCGLAHCHCSSECTWDFWLWVSAYCSLWVSAYCNFRFPATTDRCTAEEWNHNLKEGRVMLTNNK